MESNLKELEKTINELSKFKKQDTARLNALIRILDGTRFKKEKELVMNYYDEANKLSIKLNNNLGTARCLFVIASYNKSCSNYTLAIEKFYSVNAIVGNNSDTLMQKLEASANLQLGNIYIQQENYYKMIGIAYEALHNSDKAIFYNKLFLIEAEKNIDKASIIDPCI